MGLLFHSLAGQWMIDDYKYTIKFELSAIAFIWFFFNTWSLSTWVVNTSLFTYGKDEPIYFSMLGLRDYDFICVALRSILSIVVTSFWNLKESFTIDQAAERVPPPTQSDLDEMTTMLRVPTALYYFLSHLVELDAQKDSFGYNSTENAHLKSTQATEAFKNNASMQ